MDLYAQHILDHYRNPRSKTRIPGATVTHEETNPSCGDMIVVDLAIGDRVAIGWEGSGCAISQAAMSMLAEEFSGKPLADVEALTPAGMLERLGVEIGPRRMKCALLGLHTLKNALREHAKRDRQNWAETLNENIV